ncbi:DUF1631 family protein [Xanthomonadaceae bacterium XH05]|nr:DUF1631 family protein [Xanthomonadaceae bacterium XH05]
MSGVAPFSRASTSLAKVRIADHGFSPRQRTLLEGLFRLFSDEFIRSLERMLNELEQDMFRRAEQARSNEVQRSLLETQRVIREQRERLTPAFLASVETALATLADPPAQAIETSDRPQFSELSLVDTGAMDETMALKEIATRAEIRNSLALFLLGQRLGVVARRPAYDAQHLPLGPHRLCQLLREAVGNLDLSDEERGLLYRQFDRSVMQYLTPFYEALNNFLIEGGVLPHLTYVSPRSIAAKRRGAGSQATPPTSRPEEDTHRSPEARPVPPHGEGMSGASPHMPAPGHAASPGHPASPNRPMLEALLRQGMSPAGNTATPHPPAANPRPAPPRPPTSTEPSTVPWNHSGSASGGEDKDQEVELFDTLRRLLSGRRNLLDKLQSGATGRGQPATPEQLQHSLDQLQQRHNARLAAGGALPFSDVKRELQSQLRSIASDGLVPQLTGEHGDTVDLVGMLFDQLAQDVRPQSPGGTLLAQLQLPLLRVALQDRDFFTDRAHPARRMLEAVAETSMFWSGEDEIDRELIQKMSTLVRRANEEQSADPSLFRTLMSDLTGHLTTQQRKAEVAERRHVEAARGREKLEISRLKAEEAIESALAGKTVPKFLQTLLEQVWTDVLALALLRGGSDSPVFQQHLNLATRLIDASVQGGAKVAFDADESARMRSDIEAALAQVGHAGEDAGDICTRLLSAAVETAPATGSAAEPESRTELTMKLRNRARLGQDVQSGGRTATARKVDISAPLLPEEKAWHDRLKRLPYGTWFDFTINQQGDRTRRRMSWFSTVTDHCLFVNHRGQRAGDYTLSWLAREMHRGNVRLVEPERGSIVDRAWKAIISTLRSFSGNADAAVPATT